MAFLCLTLLLSSLLTAPVMAFDVEYDKIVHFRSFAVMSFLLRHYRGMDGEQIMLFLSSLGAIDEYVAQYYFASTEGTEDADLVADICGTLFSLVVYELLETNGLIRPVKEYGTADNRLIFDLSLGTIRTGSVSGFSSVRMTAGLGFPSNIKLIGEGSAYVTDQVGEAFPMRTMGGRLNMPLGETLGLSLGMVQPTLTLTDSSIYRTLYSIIGLYAEKELRPGITVMGGADFLNFIPNSIRWWGEERDIIREITPEKHLWAYKGALEMTFSEYTYGRLDVIRAFTSSPRFSLSLGLRF
jgi:hypothetical protein